MSPHGINILRALASGWRVRAATIPARDTFSACEIMDLSEDAKELEQIIEFMADRPAKFVLRAEPTPRPVVPWLPDHPLYVVLAEFDGWPGRGPRFICDQYGIPRRSMEWGDPIAHETRLDRDATRAAAEARSKHFAGRYGNTAIARLEIVEATIGDGP